MATNAGGARAGAPRAVHVPRHGLAQFGRVPAGYAPPAWAGSRLAPRRFALGDSAFICAKVSSSRNPAGTEGFDEVAFQFADLKSPVMRTSRERRSNSVWRPSKQRRHSTSGGGMISMASV